MKRSTDSEARVTAVVGFGRCGTTMVMAMLHAGGMPVLADLGTTSFEHSAVSSSRNGASDWIQKARGRAVKMLDITVFPPPYGESYNFIWLDRDPRQQALSQIRFMAIQGVPVRENRQTAGKLAASFKSDRAMAFATMRAHREARILTLRFESVLADPTAAAMKLQDFLAVELDVGAAAAVVRERSPKANSTLMEFAERRNAPP